MPDDDINSPTTANPTAVNSATTTYTVTVTDANGCSASDNVTHTVTPALIASAGPDVSDCVTFSAPIGGTPSATGGTAPYSYSWSPPTGLSSPAVANPVATTSSTRSYQLSITDANGCTSSDFVIAVSYTHLRAHETS